MFPYSSATKNKSLKLTKVPPELIQHLKSTAQIPKRSYKENQNPKQFTNMHMDTKPAYRNQQVGGKTAKLVKSKTIEQDISKIADSYVLEGNFLKKHQAYQQAINKDKKKVINREKQNSKQLKTLDRKEILKLEYLQKMGFLRPEQKQILAQYRKMHGQQPLIDNKKQYPAPTINPTTSSNHKMPESLTEGHSHLPFYSPKGMDIKKLPQTYFSNNKFMYPPNTISY